jgi:hypothetical protein
MTFLGISKKSTNYYYPFKTKSLSTLKTLKYALKIVFSVVSLTIVERLMENAVIELQTSKAAVFFSKKIRW